MEHFLFVFLSNTRCSIHSITPACILKLVTQIPSRFGTGVVGLYPKPGISTFTFRVLII